MGGRWFNWRHCHVRRVTDEGNAAGGGTAFSTRPGHCQVTVAGPIVLRAIATLSVAGRGRTIFPRD